MALRSPGSNIPQVASGLLGTYSPNLRQSVQNRIGGSSGLFGGGGGLNLNLSQPSGGATDLNALTAKYLKNAPQIDVDTDPNKLYEGSIGGLRQDVTGAITEAGRQAISQAAATGREVADVVARYLPEAVKGFGSAAGQLAAGTTQLAAQGKIAKSELEQKRYGMAQEMARFDQAQAQQNQQFIQQLQAQYQMHREQLANNLAVARQSAQTQSQLQSIQNAHAMQLARLNQQFKMEAQQYSEAQANMRQSLQLQLYDKYFKQKASAEGRADVISGAKAIENATPDIRQPRVMTQTSQITTPAIPQNTQLLQNLIRNTPNYGVFD